MSLPVLDQETSVAPETSFLRLPIASYQKLVGVNVPKSLQRSNQIFKMKKLEKINNLSKLSLSTIDF